MYSAPYVPAPYVPPRWIYGVPWIPIWLKYEEMIGAMVKELKLQALPPESIPFEEAVAPVARTAKEERLYRIIPRGGIRIPHLHYKSDVYLLKEEQWGQFRTKMLDIFRNKLKDAGSVGFEQLMELSEVVDVLP